MSGDLLIKGSAVLTVAFGVAFALLLVIWARALVRLSKVRLSPWPSGKVRRPLKRVEIALWLARGLQPAMLLASGIIFLSLDNRFLALVFAATTIISATTLALMLSIRLRRR